MPTISVWNPTTYDEARRRLVPCFDALYGAVVELVERTVCPQPRILDLGAGTGLLSAQVVAKVEPGNLTLLDGSPAMLEQAVVRLDKHVSSLVVADFGDALPAAPASADRPSGFDVIMSSLAIHHLDDAAKRVLFARIHAALAPGGLFVNADQVAGADAWQEDYFTRHHLAEARALGSSEEEIAEAVERMKIDRYATAEAQLGWLRELEFRSAGIFFRSWRFAVYAGWKAPGPRAVAD